MAYDCSEMSDCKMTARMKNIMLIVFLSLIGKLDCQIAFKYQKGFLVEDLCFSVYSLRVVQNQRTEDTGGHCLSQYKGEICDSHRSPKWR